MIGIRINNQLGQTLIFIPMIVGLLLLFLLGTVKLGGISRSQIELQNSADAAAHAGATWVGTGLNLIAGLNKGIVAANSGERTIRNLGKAIHACTAVFGLCSSLEALYQNVGKKLIRFFHNTALNLKEMQIDIAGTIPYLVLEEVTRIGKVNGDLKTITDPHIPNGPHELDESLVLHVRNLEKDSTEPAELDQDYRERSNLKVTSCNENSCTSATATVLKEPQQRPEDLMEMTWRAKLYK